MEQRLDWYRALSPQDRSWVGLIAQAGIAAFVGWYRRPSDPVQLTADVFGAAPRELTRSISLQQTLDLLRTVVDVVEERASLHAAPGAQQAVRESVLRFSREVAFAAAHIYARAAEERGAWDARLEALIVDALVRAEPDDALHSRAAALGWAEADRVAVMVGRAPHGPVEDVVADVRRQAQRLGADALVGVQGERIIVVLGRSEDPLVVAPDVAAHLGAGPVVTGPVVPTLGDAARSARAAIAGLVAARARPEAPRPVAADDLLPERLLSGDDSAREELIARGYRPLAQAAASAVLETAQAYLTLGSSIEATARHLFVHPNTVRYRLRRIGELTGWDPTRARDAYVLRTAIAAGLLAQSPE
jgi:sugar diacid utilization regulator